MPTATTATTSENVALQLHQVDRLLTRMAHLLDDADHPSVHIRACYDPSLQIHWRTYTEWVRACDWLSDIGADMATREFGGGDGSAPLVSADTTVDGIDVTFTSSKRQA